MQAISVSVSVPTCPADRVLRGLERAYAEVEAALAQCLTAPKPAGDVEGVSGAADGLKVRLADAFAALTEKRVDPLDRLDHITRAAAIFGPDEPLVARLAGVLALDQAWFAATARQWGEEAPSASLSV